MSILFLSVCLVYIFSPSPTAILFHPSVKVLFELGLFARAVLREPKHANLVPKDNINIHHSIFLGL